LTRRLIRRLPTTTMTCCKSRWALCRVNMGIVVIFAMVLVGCDATSRQLCSLFGSVGPSRSGSAIADDRTLLVIRGMWGLSGFLQLLVTDIASPKQCALFLAAVCCALRTAAAFSLCDHADVAAAGGSCSVDGSGRASHPSARTLLVRVTAHG
jgi:hypothetical protein